MTICRYSLSPPPPPIHVRNWENKSGTSSSSFHRAEFKTIRTKERKRRSEDEVEKNQEYQEENISDQVEVEAEGKTWRMDKRSVAYY